MFTNYSIKQMIRHVLIVFMLALGSDYALAVVDMTPYPKYHSPGKFWQGAQYELAVGKDLRDRMIRDFADMRFNYNINCVNLYGLENLSTRDKDLLFTLLRALGMQAVVRIEWYNAAQMNFEPADADSIINHYSSLIQYVSSPARRAQVAYFALNVPVDDPAVADNFKIPGQYENGRDNPVWASSQVTYVKSFVAKMRAKCNSYGFTAAKQYASVFYGWDYAYPVPSYASSNADGYFFNNYSYPQNPSSPPDSTANDTELINQARLQIGMTKFMQQYPKASQKKVIEYGFHTSEFNGGVNPNQIAGLVKSIVAKRKGLRATTAYYSPVTFPGMRGTQYFGWNLLKQEGSPSALMDWCLNYPKKGKVEAENCEKYGLTFVYRDVAASDGKGTALKRKGSALALYQASKSAAFQIRYACNGNSQLSLYIDGKFRQKISFPATGAWIGKYDTLNVDMSIAWGATIRLQFDDGDNAVNIDYIHLMERSSKSKVEAENCLLSGNARIFDDGSASNGKGVAGLDNNGDAVAIPGTHVKAGSSFNISYACEGNNQLSLYINNVYIKKIDFPSTGTWSGTYSMITVSATIPAGATIKIQHDDGDRAANIDYFELEMEIVPPLSGKVEAEIGSLSGNARVYTDDAASNGAGVAGLDANGDAVSIANVVGVTSFDITYACEGDNQLSLYVNGIYRQKINFPSTGSWSGTYSTVTVNAAIPAGATIKVQHDDGDRAANIDYFELEMEIVPPFSGKVEAEIGSLTGNARVYTDDAASNGAGVAGLVANGDAISIENVAGVSSFDITYACEGDNQLSLYVNGIYKQKINFPSTGTWTGTYATVTVNATIPAGATVKIQHDDADRAANIDYFTFGSTLKKATSTTDNIITSNIDIINAYPNPFNDELKIVLPETSGFKKLLVFNATGQLIEVKNVEGIGELTIGSSYKQGAYWLQFVSGSKVKSLMIIKN